MYANDINEAIKETNEAIKEIKKLYNDLGGLRIYETGQKNIRENAQDYMAQLYDELKSMRDAQRNGDDEGYDEAKDYYKDVTTTMITLLEDIADTFREADDLV